jgi:hypothetical protein
VHRNVAQRGVETAASRAGLGKVTPHDLRRSFCSLAGRRSVDPGEAAQITGHSPAVLARFYARSFGKAQRDEARGRLLEYGFGAVSDAQVEGPLAPRSRGSPSDDELSSEVDAEAQETPADEEVPEDGAYRDRTGDLRLAKLYSTLWAEPGRAGITRKSRSFLRCVAGIGGSGRGLPATSCGMCAGWTSCLAVQQTTGLKGNPRGVVTTPVGALGRPRARLMRDEIVGWL